MFAIIIFHNHSYSHRERFFPRTKTVELLKSTTSANEKRWVVCYAESRGLIATERKVESGGTIYTNLTCYKSKDDIPEEE